MTYILFTNQKLQIKVHVNKYSPPQERSSSLTSQTLSSPAYLSSFSNSPSGNMRAAVPLPSGASFLFSKVDLSLSINPLWWHLLSPGIGYSMLLIVIGIGLYYNVIIAWIIYYLIEVFISLPTGTLPWTTCGNRYLAQIWKFVDESFISSWNTENCMDINSEQGNDSKSSMLELLFFPIIVGLIIQVHLTNWDWIVVLVYSRISTT